MPDTDLFIPSLAYEPSDFSRVRQVLKNSTYKITRFAVAGTVIQMSRSPLLSTAVTGGIAHQTLQTRSCASRAASRPY